MINPVNVGYLPGIVYKELLAGRTVEVTGSVVLLFASLDDYRAKKDKLTGKFGEVVAWPAGKRAMVATRSPPKWAEKMIHSQVWECEEMFRWQVPEGER